MPRPPQEKGERTPSTITAFLNFMGLSFLIRCFEVTVLQFTITSQANYFKFIIKALIPCQGKKPMAGGVIAFKVIKKRVFP
jgi:hypothetical protein